MINIELENMKLLAAGGKKKKKGSKRPSSQNAKRAQTTRCPGGTSRRWITTSPARQATHSSTSPASIPKDSSDFEDSLTKSISSPRTTFSNLLAPSTKKNRIDRKTSRRRHRCCHRPRHDNQNPHCRRPFSFVIFVCVLIFKSIITIISISLPSSSLLSGRLSICIS